MEIGTSYNDKNNTIENKLDKIPVGKDVFILLKNNKPFETGIINLTFNKNVNGGTINKAGSSVTINKNDKSAAFYIKLNETGHYRLIFTTDKNKVIFEKEVDVV